MTTSRARKHSGSISTRSTATKGDVFDVTYSWREESGRRRTTTKRGFPTQAAAQAHLNEKLASITRGQYIEPSGRKLGDYLDEWLDALKVRQQTLNGYRTKIRLHVKPHIGHRPLGKVTGVELSALYRKLEREGSPGGNGPLSAAPVRQVHEILSGAFKAAVRDGLIAANPAARADPPRLSEAKRFEYRTWDASELKRFLAGTADHRHGAVWAFLALSGCRRGEALGLRWDDVDLDAGTALIRETVGMARGTIVRGATKSGKARRIHLDSSTVQVLRRHRAAQAAERLELGERWRDEGLVFARGGYKLRAGATAGGPLNPDKLSEAFATAVDKLGLPKVRLHDLRHTWATLALRAGVPVKVVQERLGHATPTITMNVYAQVLPGMDRDAADAVAALLV